MVFLQILIAQVHEVDEDYVQVLAGGLQVVRIGFYQAGFPEPRIPVIIFMSGVEAVQILLAYDGFHVLALLQKLKII